MTFYIILLIAVMIGMFVIDRAESPQTKKLMTLFFFIGLTLISGTRFELGGSDYYVYRRGYDAVLVLWDIADLESSVGSIRLVNLFEPGFLVFCSLVKTLGFSFYGFTLIEAVVWYVCMYVGLRRYVDNWGMIFLVFLYKLFFYNTFISLRQAITIALFMAAWRFIQDKKPIPYYLICFLALTFHNGALIMFVVYPIVQLRLTKQRLMTVNVVCGCYYLLSLFGISVFGFIEKALQGLPGQSALVYKIQVWLSASSGISMFHVFEYFLLMALVIINYEKIIETDKNAEFILKLFLILLPIFTILGENIVATRFKDYFTITYGIILLYLCRIREGKLKLLVQCGTICICAYGYIRYLLLFDQGGLTPYTSYIIKGLSIFN